MTLCGYTYEPDDPCECVENRGHIGMHKCLHEQAADKLNKILANQRVDRMKEKTMIEPETPISHREEGTTSEEMEDAYEAVYMRSVPVEYDVSVKLLIGGLSSDFFPIIAALQKQTDINHRLARALDRAERRLNALEK